MKLFFFPTRSHASENLAVWSAVVPDMQTKIYLKPKQSLAQEINPATHISAQMTSLPGLSPGCVTAPWPLAAGQRVESSPVGLRSNLSMHWAPPPCPEYGACYLFSEIWLLKTQA